MEFIYIITLFVTLAAGFLSSLAGGGGSFITTPYWLIAGLSPMQGATTGAFMGLGMSTSSVAAFRRSGHLPGDKKLILLLLVITLITSSIGPFFLPHVSTDVFKPILALLTIGSLPFLFIDRGKIKLCTRNKYIGVVVISLLLLASSFITSSAFSILIAVTLLQMFHLTTMQGLAMRRLISIVQSIVIFIILVTLGGFVWQHAFAGLIGGSVGSYFGTKIMIRKGEKFAKYALAIGAIISTSALFIIY